jgi:hypothetical protein
MGSATVPGAKKAANASKTLQSKPTGGRGGRTNGDTTSSAGSTPSQKAPANVRTVKSSAKTGTVSRSAARAAVKAISSPRA